MTTQTVAPDREARVQRFPRSAPKPGPSLWGMTPELSQKLASLRSTLIFLVVAYHVWKAIENNWLTPEAMLAWGGMATLIIEAIGAMVIPLFFSISGFLFFFNIEFVTDRELVAKCVAKVRSRLRSLGVPYLAWSGIWMLLFFVLQSIPGSESYFSNPDKIMRDMSPWKLVSTLLFNPLPYQLWFIRAAIALVCLTPLIALGLRKAGVVFVIGIGLVWMFGVSVELQVGGYNLLPGGAVFPFVLGGYLALRRPYVEVKRPTAAGWLWVVWLACIVASSCFPEIYQRFDRSGMILACIGMLTIWLNYESIRGALESRLSKLLGGSAFFVFAMHEPLLMIPIKLGANVFGSHPTGAFLGLFVLSALTIAICSGSAMALHRLSPPVYRILNGGR